MTIVLNGSAQDASAATQQIETDVTSLATESEAGTTAAKEIIKRVGTMRQSFV